MPIEQGKWDTLAPVFGHRPHSLDVAEQLGDGKCLAEFKLGGGAKLEIIVAREVLWILTQYDGRGIGLRGIYSPDGKIKVRSVNQHRDGLELDIDASTMGRFRAILTIIDREQARFRWQAFLTPAEDLLMPPQPWNIYPVNQDGDPLPTRGIVYASQRGTAAGYLYFSLTDPKPATCYYLQNLTALNDYCEQTQTEPEEIVKTNWPGLGYLPPPSDTHPLKKGRELNVCDAFVQMWPDKPEDNHDCVRRFLDSTAAFYPALGPPDCPYRDWPTMAAATVRDLTNSSKLWVEEQGYLYLQPYTAAEYPDSMVQLSVLVGLLEYQHWIEERLPIAVRLREAVDNFFDPKLGILRRYLATVGPDKEANKSDSWYVYHPLLNLARLALADDKDAKKLFLRCMDYAMKVAHEFDYLWPVMFDLTTLEVLTENRKPGEGGQTDVGGLYAYVMLQAFDLTGEEKYVDEAIAAVKATCDLGFTIGYQFNNVAWGAVACLRLYKQTGDAFFLGQADVYFASFFHNVNLWECELGPSKHYVTFMGVTCLHDGPYMAAYEEFEAYSAFHEALAIAGEDLPASSQLLIAEYCRHALDRSWFFFPSTLPPEILATDVRNGHIDRSLAIPLEDLYASRQPPGQVGQEVYGSGMAMTLLTRSHHKFEKAPFILFSGYPIREKTVGRKKLSLRLWGGADFSTRCRLFPRDDQPMPAVRVTVRGHDGRFAYEGSDTEFDVPGGGRVEIEW